jgi:hypothetical protein
MKHLNRNIIRGHVPFPPKIRFPDLRIVLFRQKRKGYDSRFRQNLFL